MQLFICPQFKVSGSEILVDNNVEMVNQLRKVLRAKPGYKFFLQDNNGEKRYNVELISFLKDGVNVKILGEEKKIKESEQLGMLIALPNKQEKLELIVQKLTEVGVTHIFLWKSDRSQISGLNENKLIRINRIIKEAVEQSWGWTMPKIEVLKDIKQLHNEREFIIFDIGEHIKSSGVEVSGKPLLGVVGPEGGLSQNDYKEFPHGYVVKSLGDSILRMETAAIIGGWLLKNKNIEL